MEELIQTIPKNSILNSSQDYEFLRQKGLEHIQQLGSKIWTDYNYHDPGITLMELLSYAITDLGYRTGFEVKDILAPADGNYEIFKDSIHKAASILPCNQITVLDLKKILVDIDGIRNVWIKPKKTFESEYFVDFNNSILNSGVPPLSDNILSLKVTELKGLYDIVIEFDRNEIKSGDTISEGKALQEARKEVHKYRNFSEDYHSTLCNSDENIYVKQPDGTETIKLFADIDITADAKVEEILAEALFKIEQFLAPHVDFYSLKELFDKGLTSDQIFEGPLLSHGFIDTKELASIQKFEAIHTSDIYNILMDITGVTAVRNLKISRKAESLCLQTGEAAITEDNWVLNLHNKLFLNHPLDLELRLNTTIDVVDGDYDGVNQIRFFRGDHEIPVQTTEIAYEDVKSKLETFRISERKKKLKFDNEIFDLEIPKGEFRELDDYYPIQNELPLTYGTGEAGLPENSTEERKAKAKQLKAYLMFFEQVLADYLAQLYHIRDLFSWNDKLDKTYFTQLVKEIKDVEDLYVPTYLDEDGNPVNLVIGNVLQENTLEEVLQKDTESPDLFYDRRSRFLNHLIARFNERFTEYTIVMSGIGKKDFIIPDKSHFLADYNVISHDRGKAFDYKKIKLIQDSNGDDYKPDTWDTENVTGYERRVCRFLGIENFKRRYLFTGHNFSIDSIMDPSIEVFYFRLYIPFGDIVIELTEDGFDPTHGDSLTEFENFLNNATLGFNYNEVDSFPDYWFEILDNTSTTVLATSQKFGSTQERDDALGYTGLYFADIDTNGYKPLAEDGVHVIEHILLRPKNNEYNFLNVSVNPTTTDLVGDYKNVVLEFANVLNNSNPSNVIGSSVYEIPETGNPVLLYNIIDGNYLDIIESLKIFAVDFNQYVLGGTSGNYYFQVINDGNIPLGESISYSTPEERNVALLKFLAFFNSLQNNPIGTCPSTVDPYSFRATVVLPAWTDRAKQFSYRKMAENIIRLEAPAHVALDIFWINQEDMKNLEICYQKFLHENAKGIPNEDFLTQDEEELKNNAACLIDKLNNLKDAYSSIYDVKVYKNEDYFRGQPANEGHIFADVTDPENVPIILASIIGGDPLPPFIDIQKEPNYLENTYGLPPDTFIVGDIVFVIPDDFDIDNVYPGEWTVFVQTINQNEQISCNEVTIKIIPDSEAVWVINEPKHAHCYDINDVLAYAFDANNSPSGEVVDTIVVSGSLPPGTDVTAEGKIIVIDPDALDAPVDLAQASQTYIFTVRTEDFTGGITQTKLTITIPFDNSLSGDFTRNGLHVDKYLSNADIIKITDTDGIASATIIAGTTLIFLNSIGIDMDGPEGPVGDHGPDPINIYFRVFDHTLLKNYVDAQSIITPSTPSNPLILTFPITLEITDDCDYTDTIVFDIQIRADIEATVIVIPIQHVNAIITDSFINGNPLVTISDYDEGINTVSVLPDYTVLSDVGLALSYKHGNALIKITDATLFEEATETGGLFTPLMINSQEAFSYSFDVETLDNCGGTTSLTITIEMYKDREAIYVFPFLPGTSYLAYLNYTPPFNYEPFEEEITNAPPLLKTALTNQVSPLNTPVLFDTANPVVASVSDPDGPITKAIEIIDPPIASNNSFYKMSSPVPSVSIPIAPVFNQSLASWGAILNPITGTISVALNSKTMKQRFEENGIGTHYHRIETTDIFGGTSIHELEIVIGADLPAVYSPVGIYPRSVGSYNPGDVIKFPTDPNGAIVKASIISGSLPPGTEFNKITGEIRVIPEPEVLTVSEAPSLINFTFGDVKGTVESLPTSSSSESVAKKAPVTSTPVSTTPKLTSGEWNLVISTIDVYGGLTENIAVNIKILPKITVSTITAVKGKGTIVTSLPGKYPTVFPSKTTSTESK